MEIFCATIQTYQLETERCYIMDSDAPELYYPCLRNHYTGEFDIVVESPMAFSDAIVYLKKHYPGAWENVNAKAVSVSEIKGE